MAGEPILIVDDNAINLKLARTLLTHQGYDVHTASDAEQALEVLAHLRPRAILMDVQLPGMDGLELTRRLKRDPERRDIPIIALTAYAMTGDEARVLEAGCSAYMSKPFDAATLRRVVADVIAASAPPAGGGGSGG